LITISTRAQLKKYHTYQLRLGTGDNGHEWEFDRIGAERERMSIEKELKELQERLAMVDQWKTRREEIDAELKDVLLAGGKKLLAADGSDDGEKVVDQVVESIPQEKHTLDGAEVEYVPVVEE